MKKFLAILSARNKEFFRDRAALSWNFMFPVLLLFAFGFMFSDESNSLYKVGLIKTSSESTQLQAQVSENKKAFESLKFIDFVAYQDVDKAIQKVDQHKIDLLVDFAQQQYWVNETSSKGYIVEQLLIGQHPNMQRSQTDGRAIRYVDWVMPGILGMNMMFSCLFGVGYVIVRYRKNGVLKRFQATPLTAFEFLSAQIVSRLLIVIAVTSILFIGCNFLLDFYVLGSVLDLLIVAILGASSMIALSLLIASKSSSEEFTGGLLNFASWPMMLLSGVWFSLEGAHPIVQKFSQIFPLTHILNASRDIMTDGASLYDVQYNLLVLAAMTLIFLALGSWMFNWGSERT
ncbi:ABC transporter permease [Aliikangiella coralliicola]|uniref:ABC transporter permease n=1 Tax=Aliikangiella coralliicola TaxID=2592383 RepID=A0A545TW86_9GAMM|nr:ABC transporter permease [Aliikangiella coralliicola]TQV81479.1 ABC transporter permease [Aliikangiella coralliicola]